MAQQTKAKEVDYTDHNPVERERHNEVPLTTYYMCQECGRSENTIEELENRPCKKGISVRE